MNPAKQTSETELLQKIYEGDYDAIKDLYEKYSPLLYTLLKKILKDQKNAEEVLIETFITILKRINYFNFNSGNPYTWLVTLAKNRAVYELRKKDGRVENPSAELESEYTLPRLSHLTESLDLRRAFGLKNKIEASLNKLTDAQQYVIYLAYYEGLTRYEIAKKLKIPHTTVESKIKTSFINLNENFLGKPSLFTVKNEVVELIYPFVLGCLDYEEQIRTYDRFKATETFPWKLLGEYQNLVSLLPVILEIEYPTEAASEKMSNSLYHFKSKKSVEKTKTFEEVSSTSSRIMSGESVENDQEKITEDVPSIPEEISKASSEEEIPESGLKRKQQEFEPVIPFKPEMGTLENSDGRKKNYSSFIIIGLIILFIVSAVLAYLFYNDRTTYYENQIENLTNRLETLTNDFQSRPEIPGLAKLINPRIVELANKTGAVGSGEIILSYTDKRGYLHIRNLPVLDPDNAYQLWGNYNGSFISLGVFKISSGPDYYPFTVPESVNNGPIEFYLIESNAEGSRRPGSKIYLQGKAE